MIPLSLLNYMIDKNNRKLPPFKKTTILPAILGGLALSLGNIFFFLAYGVGDASLVAPVSSTYAALTVVLAIIFLKEKVTKKQLGGIIFTIMGIILVGVTF